MRRQLIRWVVLLYPTSYRATRGDEILAGLLDAADDASRLRFLTHVRSVALHALAVRGRLATGGDRRETLRQGLVLAGVAVLGIKTGTEVGTLAWPWAFTVALLLTGLAILLVSRRWWQHVAGAVLMVVAAHEWPATGHVLPGVGEISLELLGLAAMLIAAGRGRSSPLRILAGISASWVLLAGFDPVGPTFMFSMEMGVASLGLLIGVGDARVAAATGFGIALYGIQQVARPDRWLTQFPGPLGLYAIVAACALALTFRRFQGEAPTRP